MDRCRKMDSGAMPMLAEVRRLRANYTRRSGNGTWFKKGEVFEEFADMPGYFYSTTGDFRTDLFPFIDLAADDFEILPMISAQYSLWVASGCCAVRAELEILKAEKISIERQIDALVWELERGYRASDG